MSSRYIALDVHAAIAAVCPIVGVGIEDPSDQGTWRIDIDPSATDEQRQAARDALDKFAITK